MRSPVCGLSDNANRLSHITVLFPLFQRPARRDCWSLRGNGEVTEGSEREIERNRVYQPVLTPIVIILRFPSPNVPRNSHGHNE